MTVHMAGRIHGHAGANTIRVVDGRIDAIGSFDGSDGDRIDHGSRVILPGLADAHLHPFGLAAADGQVDLTAARSIADVLDRLATRMAATTGALVAIGLDDESLSEGRMPTADELDAVSADHPVLVYRHCSHVAAANRVALTLGGIGPDEPDPPGGRIVRSASGRITGVLEEQAIALVSTRMTPLLPAPDASTLQTALTALQRRGVVAVDAMVAVPGSMWCSGADEVAALAAVRTPMRIEAWVIADEPDSLRRAIDQLAEGSVRFAGWKGFADGSLGGRTAALRAPYADDPATSGMLVGHDLRQMAEVAATAGGRAAIHAIGDRAVDVALDVAEDLGPGTVRIEHASVADPDQVGRMAAAGVVASIQPSFVRSDGPWLQRRLGAKRMSWAYPFRTMAAAGVTMRAGSDAPIESPDPFVGIADATIDRTEGVDLDHAIDLYTATPLEIGMPATFVVAELDSSSVADTVVAEVWIEGGRVV